MRWLGLVALAGTFAAGGCCTTCGSCPFSWCSKNPSAASYSAAAEAMGGDLASPVVVAKPGEASVTPAPAVQQASATTPHQAFSIPSEPEVEPEYTPAPSTPATISNDHSSMPVPPRPASATYTDPDMSLPTPREIVKRSAPLPPATPKASEGWQQSPEETTPSTTSSDVRADWTPRMPPRPSTPTVGLSN